MQGAGLGVQVVKCKVSSVGCGVWDAGFKDLVFLDLELVFSAGRVEALRDIVFDQRLLPVHVELPCCLQLQFPGYSN